MRIRKKMRRMNGLLSCGGGGDIEMMMTLSPYRHL